MSEQIIFSGSKEHAALNLMRMIMTNETGISPEQTFDRKYCLTLYSQCHLAVSGRDLETILAPSQ